MANASLTRDFEALLGKENVLTSEADRQTYSYDSAALPRWRLPWLCATNTEQIGEIVKRCYDADAPMTVRGASSNLSGGTIPDSTETCVILTSGLTKILEINEQIVPSR